MIPALLLAFQNEPGRPLMSNWIVTVPAIVILVCGCATMTPRNPQLDTWTGISAKALDSHPYFKQLPMVRKRSSSGETEVRNYQQGHNPFSGCSALSGVGAREDSVTSFEFLACRAGLNELDRICDNIFEMKNGTIVRYTQSGACPGYDTYQPQKAAIQAKTTNNSFNALSIKTGAGTPEKMRSGSVSVDTAAALLGGTLTGRFACAGSEPFTVKFHSAESTNGWIALAGVFRIAPSNGSPIETSVAGLFDQYTGLLNLQTISSPPQPVTQRMVDEEQALQQQAREGFADINRLLSTANFAVQQATNLPNSPQRDEALKSAQRNLSERQQKVSDLDKRETARLANVRKAWLLGHPSPFPFKLSVGRDAEGKGWAGTFSGRGCGEVLLTSDGGLRTTDLPPINGQVAYQNAVANSEVKGDTSAQAWWLKIPAARGHSDALFALGQIYESQGVSSPEKYVLARQAYLGAASANHTKAQLALARMNERGLGAPLDVREAKRWRAIADVQRHGAAKICTSQNVLENTFRLMSEEQNDPIIRFSKALAFFAGGVAINLGNTRVTEIALADFISIDQPFTCRVVARRVGAQFANVTPDFQYAFTDENGNDLYRDQRFEAAFRGELAKLAAKGSNGDYARAVEIQPIDIQKFVLKLIPDLKGLSRDYNSEFDGRSLTLPIYRELVAAAPNVARSHQLLGQALEKNNDVAGAQQEFRKVIELESASAGAPAAGQISGLKQNTPEVMESNQPDAQTLRLANSWIRDIDADFQKRLSIDLTNYALGEKRRCMDLGLPPQICLHPPESE